MPAPAPRPRRLVWSLIAAALVVASCAGTDYSDGLEAEDVSVAALATAAAGFGCPDPALRGDGAGRGESGVAIVTGAVPRPGAVRLGAGVRTLAAVLAAAGAGEDDAPIGDIRLIRDGLVYDFEYLASRCALPPATIVVEDGDLLRVAKPEEASVTVIGEVGQQGRVRVPPGGMSVLEAIASVRGTNNVTAKRDVVYLVRRDGEKARVLRLSATDMLNNLATPVPVRNHDVLVLPPSPLAQWDRFWRQLLSFLGPAIDKAVIAP